VAPATPRPAESHIKRLGFSVVEELEEVFEEEEEFDEDVEREAVCEVKTLVRFLNVPARMVAPFLKAFPIGSIFSFLFPNKV